MLPIADAEFVPLTPQAQLAVVSILAVVLIVLQILAFFRRKPPLDSELVKIASQIETLSLKVSTLEKHREEDLHAQRTYTRETTRELFAKLDLIAESFNSNIKQIERAIGRLEGKVDGRTGT